MNVSEQRGFNSSQLEGLRQHLALSVSSRDTRFRRPLSAADSSALLNFALDRARSANALGVHNDLQQALCDAASLAATMTVRERIRGGEVVLTTPRDGELIFPDGDTDASLPLWLDGLACAVIVGDTKACEYLANTTALDYVSRAASNRSRPIGKEAFWAEYGRAFIALIQGQPIAVKYAQRARQQVQTEPTGVLVREGLEAIDLPVLQLIEIVASGATAEWPGAVQNALDRFHELFSREEYAHGLAGYLPICLLAVCSLASHRGFPFPRDSPYLPEVLNRSETHLNVRFQVQAILEANEAHWFFDLQGYLRKGRTHRLVDRDGTLVAQYEVDASAGLPPASADFIVVDNQHLTQNTIPFALDAGQLLFLAQTFASQCPGDPGADASAGRILLSDAIACIDAVLTRITAGSDTIPDNSIYSTEGRMLLTTEPGRFRRTRLTAYRASLASQLASLKGVRAGGPQGVQNDFLQIFQSVQISVDIIRAQAVPVLEAFAKDIDGTFIATLQPRDEDYEKVFEGESVNQACLAYKQFWSSGLLFTRPYSTQTEIRCNVSPAGMFTWHNELSYRFPGGYQGIARLLNPHYVWLAWQYVEPGKPSGISFDGLVWVDDHWAWFPKPYRYLRMP